MNLKKKIYIFTHWEKWHYHLKYLPLYPAWLWYVLRSGSFWWFTPSNPTLTFGGFEGESKKEMYQQLPPSTYPRSIYISPSVSFEAAKKLFIDNGFNYPFAVKPDVGMMGFMFRRIDNVEQFKKYHAIMPANYILQELIQYPFEVSVFYYRFPNQQEGNITGFIKKEMLQVEGDGLSTLWQLILNHPVARFRLDEMRSKHESLLEKIIPAGVLFPLSLAGNLSRGGKLISLAHEKNEGLLKVFDNLSHYTRHFYYGRYDIKCLSIQDLKEGKNFSILEYNGSGAEPHHIYGNGNTLLQAYKIILHHWKVLYKISKQNYKNGIKYWRHNDGYRFLRKAKRHFKVLKRLDNEFSL
ncbi:MAG: hypothetical protein ABIN97_04095 [Ginsengibacter sp.]